MSDKEDEIISQSHDIIDLYQVLLLNPGENNQDIIKKKYTELIKQFHPDKGGISNVYQQIVDAYKILSDTTLKMIYDNFGIIGVALFTQKESEREKKSKSNLYHLKIFTQIFESNDITQEEKEIAKSYLLKKIKKILNESVVTQNTDLSTEINSVWVTGVPDYLYLKHIQEEEVMLLNPMSNQTLAFENVIRLYHKENSGDKATCTLAFQIRSDYSVEHRESIGIYKKLFLPFSIFGRNSCDSEFKLSIVGPRNGDIVLSNSMRLGNVFNMENVEMFLSSGISIKKRAIAIADLTLGVNIKPYPGIEVKLPYNILSGGISPILAAQLDEDQKIFANIWLNSRKFSMTLSRVESFSNQMQGTLQSVSIARSGLLFRNESHIKLGSMQLFFKSSLNFGLSHKNARLMSFHSLLSFGIRYGNFCIQIPIIVSNQPGFLSHVLIFCASFLSEMARKGYKFLKRRSAKHVDIYNNVSYFNQMRFNLANVGEYDRKIALANANGLKILQAYIGEENKIHQIFRFYHIFTSHPYVNEDQRIFSIQIPLMLRVIDNKLEIPKDVLTIDGVFVPDYYNRAGLAVFIQYSFHGSIQSTLIKNNEREIALP